MKKRPSCTRFRNGRVFYSFKLGSMSVRKEESLLFIKRFARKPRPASGLMTEGVIWKQLLFFAIPLLLGNLFQLLYNTVDSIVVGNFVGGNALAAVGASNPIINLLVSFFTGLATGAGVLIARYFGAQDHLNLERAVHTAIVVALIAGVGLMVLGYFLSPALLQMLGTPDEVMPGAVSYMQIYFLGIIAMMLYNMGSGVLRAVGDSKRPLYYLIAACIINIILDLVFVIWFQMGIAGVAWATLIAQAVSAILVMVNLCRTDAAYKVYLKRLRLDRKMLVETVRLGLPAGLQNAIVSLSNVIVQANINSFGPSAMAGCASYNKLDGFAGLPVMSFSMAATTFIGQNIGAKNVERVKRGARTSVLLSVGVIAGLTVLLLTLGRYILRIFSPEQEILNYAIYMMNVLAPAYVFLAVAQGLCGVVRGAGLSMVPMVVLVGNFCVLRMIWIAIAMPLLHDIIVVFLGYSLTWATAAICMLIYVKKVDWINRGLRAAQQE